MTWKELSHFLNPWVAIEQHGPYGEIQQRERLMLVADRILSQGTPGDLVEIGCLHGSTTVLLAQVARKHQRKVIAIDPWQVGTQNCEGGEYEIFLRTTQPYTDVIEVLRQRSDAPEVAARLAGVPLAFAFVDGLHTHEACLKDISLVSRAALIAVDDTIWSEAVRQACRDAVYSLGKTLYVDYALRESYLLPLQVGEEPA